MGPQEITQTRILIADDDKVIAEVLRDVLASPERIIEICHDGQAAADKIQADGFDLVLVDLVMPKLGGLDVLKIAKQVNPDVIVIIVTGYASLETAVSAIKEGAYDYVMKPCKLDEFKIVIDRATEKIKLNKENKELLKKLQDASQELTQLNEKKNNHPGEDLKFFSSNRAWMHSLYDDANANFVDKLQALAYLRKSGMLTQKEFTQFKSLYLKSISETI
jgi:YesN/AraC family two-component response regulator